MKKIDNNINTHDFKIIDNNACPNSSHNMCQPIYIRDNGNHNGKKTLAHRAMSLRYYQSYMQKDASHFVQTCDQCQRYTPQQHPHPLKYHTIISLDLSHIRAQTWWDLFRHPLPKSVTFSLLQIILLIGSRQNIFHK